MRPALPFYILLWGDPVTKVKKPNKRLRELRRAHDADVFNDGFTMGYSMGYEQGLKDALTRVVHPSGTANTPTDRR